MGGLLNKLIFKSGSEALNKAAPQGFFDFKVNTILGDPFDFASLKNRKLTMVVNVACK